MANEEHLKLIKRRVVTWNKWRLEHADIRPDLSKANLRGAELSEANLTGANLSGADLRMAKLTKANLSKGKLGRTNFASANLSGADLSKAWLSEANLSGADLTGANLARAGLSLADLSLADLSKANLNGADLERARLVKTNLESTNLNGCRIYGISAWNIKLNQETKQFDLIITQWDEAAITVDNLEIAQFMYLLLNNQKIRQVIDTITSKVVLILGRFTKERKRVLDAIREELRKHDYIPVLFDFDKPASKDITGTVETLARMARFIIADLTDPSSIPHELATIVPSLRTTPVLPIRVVGSTGYTMFEDFVRSYKWVLEIYEYTDGDSLISNLPKVIAPADKMVEELRRVR